MEANASTSPMPYFLFTFERVLDANAIGLTVQSSWRRESSAPRPTTEASVVTKVSASRLNNATTAPQLHFGFSQAVLFLVGSTNSEYFAGKNLA